jgi:hypothetical protein
MDTTCIDKAREDLTSLVNTEFDRLIARLGGGDAESPVAERAYRLTEQPLIIRGTKPSALLFGDERVEVKTWTQVFAIVLARCNANERCHEALMNLRGRISGNKRILLAASPDGMTRPCRIGDDLYAESGFGSETLMHVLTQRLLKPVGFDYSDVRIVIRD